MAVVRRDQSVSWGQLRALYRQVSAELSSLAGLRTGVRVSGSADSYATLAALEGLRADVSLIDAALSDELFGSLCQTLGIPYWVDPDASSASGRLGRTEGSEAGGVSGPGGAGRVPNVTLLTSGTTGRPKTVTHTWETLRRPIRPVADRDGQTWLLTFRPHLYAGIQVALQALANGGTLVVPDADASPAEVIDLARRTAVRSISATPSYWRWLLLSVPEEQLADLSPRQITLGGEVVDQPLLDRLGQLYPQTRIAHIYATTELGRCFSVTDKRAGFPRRWLEQTLDDGITLRVRDGQLLVRSANRMLGYARESDKRGLWREDGFWATGDLVTLTDERVLFSGREDDMINVGGNKVSPSMVEQVVQEVAGVADTLVFGVDSSIAGQLVACHVVLAEGYDAHQVVQAVGQRCRSRLSRYQVPRIIEVVASLERTDAGKRQRGPRR